MTATATRAPLCSLVIPARDEEGSIGAVVAGVPDFLDVEIIVVDNASSDATAEVARRAGARVVHEPIPGYGQACRAGVAAATATSVIVFIDGDGSMDPAELPRLVGPILAGEADVVCGSRLRLAERRSMGAHQRLGNVVSVVLLRILYGVRLSELGPYRAIEAGLLRELGIGGSRYAWVAELLARAARRGARIAEVDVSYRLRSAGSSKVSGTLRGSIGAGAAIVSTLLWCRVGPGPSGTRGPVAASRLRVLAGVVVGLVSLEPIVRYLWVALHRIGYHFELEWLEGGAVELTRRVAEGHGLYGPPSLENVPWPYTPLYFYASAAVAKIVGVGFLAPRLVSFVASLAALVVLARAVRRETGVRSAGLVAAGLYAAAFRESGDWYDLARVDSLFIVLTLLALSAGRRAETVRSGCWVGLLGFLAFFTKQSAALAVAFAFVFLLVRRPRVGAAAIGVSVALVAASTAVMDQLSGGWYRYYVFDELPAQGIVTKGASTFWRLNIWHLGHPVALVALGALGAALLGWRGREVRVGVGYWASACAGLLATAWLAHQHAGGYLDVLMPAFAALAIGGGIAWGLALSGATTRLDAPRTWRLASRAANVAFPAAVAASLALQLVLWSYHPSRQIPTRADAGAGQALLARLRALPGRIVVLDHPWYGTELGKGESGQGEAIRDIVRAGPSPARTRLEAAISHELAGVSAVVLDDRGDEIGIEAVLRSHFVQVPLAWRPNGHFREITDLQLEPSLLFVNKSVHAHA